MPGRSRVRFNMRAVWGEGLILVNWMPGAEAYPADTRMLLLGNAEDVEQRGGADLARHARAEQHDDGDHQHVLDARREGRRAHTGNEDEDHYDEARDQGRGRWADESIERELDDQAEARSSASASSPAQSRELDGDVYSLERDIHGRHGRIMKYELNKT